MTVLIAWASLSVGIVMGAMWRSLCEKQSRNDTDISDGQLSLQRLRLDPRSWDQVDHAKEKRRQSA
jgi:hypothetical protein